jgi:hypothetical protein
VRARAKPIKHLWVLMDERCTCAAAMRERPHCVWRRASPCANGGFAQGLGLALCKIGVREGATCVVRAGVAPCVGVRVPVVAGDDILGQGSPTNHAICSRVSS